MEPPKRVPIFRLSNELREAVLLCLPPRRLLLVRRLRREFKNAIDGSHALKEKLFLACVIGTVRNKVPAARPARWKAADKSKSRRRHKEDRGAPVDDPSARNLPRINTLLFNASSEDVISWSDHILASVNVNPWTLPRAHGIQSDIEIAFPRQGVPAKARPGTLLFPQISPPAHQSCLDMYLTQPPVKTVEVYSTYSTTTRKQSVTLKNDEGVTHRMVVEACISIMRGLACAQTEKFVKGLMVEFDEWVEYVDENDTAIALLE